MSAHDISEAFDGLRSAILADSTFAAMLGASDAIYLSPPESREPVPLIEFRWSNWSPQDFTSTGIYRPKLTMNVFATTPQQAFGILGYLERYWTIPKHKVTPVATTNWNVTYFEMNPTGPVYVGPGQLLNSNQHVHQVNAEWDVRINKKV